MNLSELYTILLHTVWLSPVGHVMAGGTDHMVLLWHWFWFLWSYFGGLSCCLKSSSVFCPYLWKNQLLIQLWLSRRGTWVWVLRRPGQPPGAFPCSQGNPRARDEDKVRDLVSIHFFKLAPFQKPVSIVTGNCGTIVKVQKAQAGC